MLEKVGGLVDDQQVLRPALIFGLIAEVRHGVEFDLALAIVIHRRVAGNEVVVDQLLDAVCDALELRALATKYLRPRVLGERKAHGQVGLAPTCGAAEADHVGLTIIGHRLGPGQWAPRMLPKVSSDKLIELLAFGLGQVTL